MSGPLANILPACEWVAVNAQFVRIDETAIARTASTLAPLLPKRMQHTPHHLRGSGEETVAYFLILDTLNFGSGFFEHLRPYHGHTGYFWLATALRDWFGGDGVPTPAALRTLDANAIGAILHQDATNPALSQLFEWFAAALHDLGAFVSAELGGNYSNILDRSSHRANHIVDLLCKMAMYRDVAQLDGRVIPLLKRAQIFVHDIGIALDDAAAPPIQELEQLTVFADNMLPFVLENFGVLSYEAALAARIASGELRPGERAEIELRANAIWASELLRRELAKQGAPTTAREIDFALWNAGVGLEHATSKRPHVCRTYFY